MKREQDPAAQKSDVDARNAGLRPTSAATSIDLDGLLALFTPEPYTGLQYKLVCPQCQGLGVESGRNHDDPRWLPCPLCNGDCLAARAREVLGRSK